MQFDLAAAVFVFLIFPIILWLWRSIAALLIGAGGPFETLGKGVAGLVG